MSCKAQNYDSRSGYEQNMQRKYHSPVWEQNVNTRTQYDLDLQNQYLSAKDRYIPNFPANFKPRENQGQAPWKSFDNVMTIKENYAGNALCHTPRTQYDLDMIQSFDCMCCNEHMVPKKDLKLFDNLSTEGNKIGYMCSNVPINHGSGHFK